MWIAIGRLLSGNISINSPGSNSGNCNVGVGNVYGFPGRSLGSDIKNDLDSIKNLDGRSKKEYFLSKKIARNTRTRSKKSGKT